jgi:hypothetical protein
MQACFASKGVYKDMLIQGMSYPSVGLHNDNEEALWTLRPSFSINRMTLPLSE